MPKNTTAGATPRVGRILVCDDDAVAARAVAEMLAAAGYECEVAATHAEAWVRLAGGAIAVVTSDISSDVDFEFVRALSHAPTAPAVLIVTDTPSVVAAQRALRVRAFDYIVLPGGGSTLPASAAAATVAYQARRTLHRQREQYERSVQEMVRCDELVRDGQNGGEPAAMDAYLTLAIGQAIDTVATLGDFARLMVSPASADSPAHRLQNARPLRLIDAVRETILVLERTKSSFRSRELADLRKKLEDLMRVDGPDGSEQ